MLGCYEYKASVAHSLITFGALLSDHLHSHISRTKSV